MSDLWVTQGKTAKSAIEPFESIGIMNNVPTVRNTICIYSKYLIWKQHKRLLEDDINEEQLRAIRFMIYLALDRGLSKKETIRRTKKGFPWTTAMWLKEELEGVIPRNFFQEVIKMKRFIKVRTEQNNAKR